MTRGTFYLFLNDKVIESCEFNGDMYGSPKDSQTLQRVGNYRLAVSKLKEVKDRMSFEEKIREFDRVAEFNYQDEEGNYFRFYEHPLKRFLMNRSNEVDMTRKHYFELFFSDYIYIKNLSGKDLRVREYNNKNIAVIPNGKIATFYFGELIETI